MNRRDFLKTSAAVTAAVAAGTVLSPKAFAAANHPYTRPLHFMYPELLQQQKETFTTLSKALDKVNNPELSFLSPLFLNVTDFSGYSNIISYCSTNKIKFGPAVGGPGPGNKLTDPDNQAALHAVRTQGFQPYLRVDNLSGFYGNNGGEEDIKSFLRQAISYGFTNIMLNPWPQIPKGQPNAGMYMPITESDIIPYIDSCFQNASYKDYTVIDADVQNILTQAKNWAQGTPQIIINYESPGPQGVIANDMTLQEQINTFNTTESSIKSYPIADHLHFALPFTGSYDPLKQKNPSTGATMWNSYMVTLIESWQG